MLTNSSDYLLSPDIIVCPSLEVVYEEVDRGIEEGDDTLLIYVDSLFVDIKVLNQLQLYRYEFKEFGIIIDKEFETVLEIKGLHIECYLSVRVSNVASDIFLNAEKYADRTEPTLIGDLERGLESKVLMKNMVEYDFLSFKSTMIAILNKSKLLEEHNSKLREELRKYVKEKSDLLHRLARTTVNLKRSDKNRVELLTSNNRLKYESYLDDLGSKTTSTVTPLIYIKAMLSKDEDSLIRFYSIFNSHLRSKFNKNSALIVINDFNRLKLKKVREGFSYVSSDGRYNLKPVGNQIMTTSQHVESLFENLEKFAGIKDLYIVLDISCSTKTFVVGDGVYTVILNDSINENLHSNIMDIVRIEEKSILDTVIGEDEFNLELNVSKSEIFKQYEKIAMEMI